MTAIDVDSGDIAWQVPFCTTNGTPAGLKTGGNKSGGGPISAAGRLIFIGASKDRTFHAFAAKTGEELWRTKLKEIEQPVPITWQPGWKAVCGELRPVQSSLHSNWDRRFERPIDPSLSAQQTSRDACQTLRR